MESICKHLESVEDVAPNAKGCEECLAKGDTWIHLRLCTTCGHVGCCDSSKNKHATKHYKATEHPVIKSLESGEYWGYCYADDIFVEKI